MYLGKTAVYKFRVCSVSLNYYPIEGMSYKTGLLLPIGVISFQEANPFRDVLSIGSIPSAG